MKFKTHLLVLFFFIFSFSYASSNYSLELELVLRAIPVSIDEKAEIAEEIKKSPNPKAERLKTINYVLSAVECLSKPKTNVQLQSKIAEFNKVFPDVELLFYLEIEAKGKIQITIKNAILRLLGTPQPYSIHYKIQLKTASTNELGKSFYNTSAVAYTQSQMEEMLVPGDLDASSDILLKNLNTTKQYDNLEIAAQDLVVGVEKVIDFLIKKLDKTVQNTSFPIAQNLGTSFPTLTKPSTAPSASNQIVDYAGLSASDKQKLQTTFANAGFNIKVYVTSESNKIKNSETATVSDYQSVATIFENKSALGNSDMAIWTHYDPNTKKVYYKVLHKTNFFISTRDGIVSDPEKLRKIAEEAERNALQNKEGFNSNFWNSGVSGIQGIAEVAKLLRTVSAEVKIPDKVWRTDEDYIIKGEAIVCGVGNGVVNVYKDLADLFIFAGTLFDKNEREDVKDAISEIDVSELASEIYNSKKDKYTGREDVAEHELGKDVVLAVEIVAGFGVFVKASEKASQKTAKIVEKFKETKVVKGAVDDLLSFVNKTLKQKLDDIKGIWNTKYPVQEMLEGRSFFEDIMGHYRYAKNSGWSHTGDISEFFKGVDFYKGTAQGSNIFAETAVSMKTTITTNVDTWLASAHIQKNIQFLNQGKSVDGLLSNGKTMFITNAEIHVYMPKANITETLKTTWMNKLTTTHPGIKFEIKALEDFVN